VRLQCSKAGRLTFLAHRQRTPTHSMHTGAVQPRKIPVRWITLPLFSANMLWFLMFVPCQRFHNSAFHAALTPSDDFQFFSSRLFSGDCSLFALFSDVAPFVFSNLQPLFEKHPGGGVPLP
jgi:hypothetical protein